MTTFTNISNALVAVGARPFATTIQALRDNPLAIQEGDATAPKIADAALSTTVTAAGQAWVNARLQDSGINAVLSTATVLAKIAGAAAGAVGTYAFLVTANTNVTITAGTTYAGSGLRYSGIRTPSTVINGTAVSGTWLAMGTVIGASGEQSVTLFLRIS